MTLPAPVEASIYPVEEHDPRERIEQADTVVARPSLDSMNDDCLVHILSYLPTDNLNNNVAFCNQRFREARNHESLDQTRTGTIMLSEGSTVVSLFTTIASNGWNERLQGNYTRLKIMGIEKLQEAPHVRGEEWRQMSIDSRLTGITSLDLTCHPASESHRMKYLSVWSLSLIFPSLREVDLSYLRVAPFSICLNFCNDCPNLSRLTWNGCEGYEENQSLHGGQFKSGSQLTELTLNNCHFYSSNSFALHMFASSEDGRFYMFRQCRSLQRLSIKNAKWSYMNHDEVVPVTQEMLIKMVRHHPTLRWLKSDLSEANIAMLKRERPEVTFVNE